MPTVEGRKEALVEEVVVEDHLQAKLQINVSGIESNVARAS